MSNTDSFEPLLTGVENDISEIPEYLDVYSIASHQNVDLLLPQNCVISIVTAPSDAKEIVWHEHRLPVWHLNDPALGEAIVLVIEAGSPKKRMVLMCDEMPEPFRLCSSLAVDLNEPNLDPSIFRLIQVSETSYQIPNLDYIQHRLQLD